MRGHREPIPKFACLGPDALKLKRMVYRCRLCPWCEIGASDYYQPKREYNIYGL